MDTYPEQPQIDSKTADLHMSEPSARERGPSGPATMAEPPELFQLKCLSPALEARPHLNRNNPSVPQI
jgi:hypothetical protein